LALAPEKADRLVKTPPLRLIFIQPTKPPTYRYEAIMLLSDVGILYQIDMYQVMNQGSICCSPHPAHLTCFGTTGGTAVAGTAGAATAAAEGSGSSCDQSISQCSVFQSCNQSIAKPVRGVSESQHASFLSSPQEK